MGLRGWAKIVALHGNFGKPYLQLYKDFLDFCKEFFKYYDGNIIDVRHAKKYLRKYIILSMYLSRTQLFETYILERYLETCIMDVIS